MPSSKSSFCYLFFIFWLYLCIYIPPTPILKLPEAVKCMFLINECSDGLWEYWQVNFSILWSLHLARDCFVGVPSRDAKKRGSDLDVAQCKKINKKENNRGSKGSWFWSQFKILTEKPLCLIKYTGPFYSVFQKQVLHVGFSLFLFFRATYFLIKVLEEITAMTILWSRI